MGRGGSPQQEGISSLHTTGGSKGASCRPNIPSFGSKMIFTEFNSQKTDLVNKIAIDLIAILIHTIQPACKAYMMLQIAVSLFRKFYSWSFLYLGPHFIEPPVATPLSVRT